MKDRKKHDCHKSTVGENIIGAPKMRYIFGSLSKCSVFQYYNSNIRLLSIAPHLVIALPTLRLQKLPLLTSLLNFLYWFADLLMASFLYCSPYSYRSFNYCDSNSCWSFRLLKNEKERQITLERAIKKISKEDLEQ